MIRVDFTLIPNQIMSPNLVGTLWLLGNDEVMAKEVGAVMIVC